MKKNALLVLALGAGAALTAAAQSNEVKTAGNWQFYGRAHLSVDSLDDGKFYDRINLSSNSSRLGFRGSKAFGDFKGIWQIESEILFNKTSDSAATQDDKNRLATRDTFAGVQGGFGQVRLGKFDTPFKVAREVANLFGDQLGDMRNLTRVGSAKFDERPNNIIEYQSSDLSGFRLAVAYAPHEGANAETNATTGVETKNAMSSGSLTYSAGNLSAALGIESYQAGATNGKRDAKRLAVSYKVMSDLKLVGFYQDVTHATDGGKVTGFGAEYQLVPNSIVLRAHYLDRNADTANADAKMTAIGIDRIVSKELRFYVNYASVDNQSASKATPWKEGRSTSQTGVNGFDAKGLSVGMRYDF